MNVTRFSLFCMAIAMLACVLTTSGCGDGRPARVPVSGRVLLDGQPLSTGVVRIVPADARVAFGQLDANGCFTLTTYEANDGCITGTHPVEIVSFDTSNEEAAIPLIPTKYNKHVTSGLNVTIDGPTDDLQFKLSSKGI